MPTTSLTVENQYLTSTMFSRLEELKNMVDRPYRFVSDMEKMGKVEKNFGERIIIPFKTNRHSSTTQLTNNGYDPINLSVSPLGTPGWDQPGDWIRPVVISGHEQRINDGAEKVLDILEERVKDAYAGLRQELQQQILSGDVATMSDLNTLNGSDATGFIEEHAVGSQVNTNHNINKTTYASLVGFQNQIADGSGNFSANGLDGLDSILARSREVTEGGSKLRWYSTIEAYLLLKTELRSQEQYIKAEDYDGGRMYLTHGMVPIVPIRDLPTDGAVTTNDPWSMLLLDWEHFYFMCKPGYWFKAGEFEKQSGYDVRASFIHLMGQTVMDYWPTHGLLFDANA